MPISVRLPQRVEQQLAEYCISHQVTKSEAVKRALERMLQASSQQPSPYDLGKDFFERHRGTPATTAIARNSKKLLREYFRGRGK